MSSSQSAIRVRGLKKSYTIRHEQTSHITLAEAMLSRLRRPLARATTETFWALSGIDFDVSRGEVVGVVGRNGAGKSTLLKVLSRITDPTEGEIDLYGRVGSLLEVGTGFHPELTGRENIYLNGAILGMRRSEITRQFDAIVDFSGVERFLDTPVKRYSSGMYVRLAFAVAAHLEPEILIVDEVLAVGDSQFQNKCIAKVRDVATSGRTVLLVSHNMATVKSLCTRVLLLKAGRVEFDGDPDTGTARYLAGELDSENSGVAAFAGDDRRPLEMTEARLVCGGQVGARLDMGQPLAVEVDYRAARPTRAEIGLIVMNADGVRILHYSSRYGRRGDIPEASRGGTLRLDLGVVPLTPGQYSVSLYLGETAADAHTAENCLKFTVIDRDVFHTGRAYQSRHSLMWWDVTPTFEPADAPLENHAGRSMPVGAAD